VYRWWEEDIDGKLVHRKAQVGDIKKYPTESAAQGAADALRLTIDNQCAHRSLRRTTINTLWEHYSQEELPLKALSTQDAYIIYANNGITPRWGDLPVEEIKTVEVGALVAINGSDGWNQSQNQVRRVGAEISRARKSRHQPSPCQCIRV
jgi:hypothetical protein